MAQETVTPPLALPVEGPAAPPADGGRRLRELDVLRRMAVSAADTVDADAIFGLARDALADLLGAELVTVAHPLFEQPREWRPGKELPRCGRSCRDASRRR